MEKKFTAENLKRFGKSLFNKVKTYIDNNTYSKDTSDNLFQPKGKYREETTFVINGESYPDIVNWINDKTVGATCETRIPEPAPGLGWNASWGEENHPLFKADRIVVKLASTLMQDLVFTRSALWDSDPNGYSEWVCRVHGESDLPVLYSIRASADYPNELLLSAYVEQEQMAALEGTVNTINTRIEKSLKETQELAKRLEQYFLYALDSENVINTTNLLPGTKDWTGWEFADYTKAGTFQGLDVLCYRWKESDTGWKDVGLPAKLNLAADTVYTFSVWLRGNGKAVTFVYPDVSVGIIYMDGEDVTVGGPDTNSAHELTQQWKRHVVVFKTKPGEALTGRSIIAARIENAAVGDTVYVAGAKLEKGDNRIPIWSDEYGKVDDVKVPEIGGGDFGIKS